MRILWLAIKGFLCLVGYGLLFYYTLDFMLFLRDVVIIFKVANTVSYPLNRSKRYAAMMIGLYILTAFVILVTVLSIGIVFSWLHPMLMSSTATTIYTLRDNILLALSIIWLYGFHNLSNFIVQIRANILLSDVLDKVMRRIDDVDKK